MCTLCIVKMDSFRKRRSRDEREKLLEISCSSLIALVALFVRTA